jgi:DNA-binding PadR family transcriptional regulator
MHGYDLRKRLRSGSGLVATLSFGSLYPALARLERDGAVREVAGPSAPVIPLTGSLSGERAAFRARLAARASHSGRTAGTRGRKVYEITPVGEETFERLLGEESVRPTDDKGFALRWSFARYLSPEGRLRLLEKQYRNLEDRVMAARRALGGPSAPRDKYERQLAVHALDSLSRDLAWVESLIEAERTGPALAGTETSVS